METYMVAGVIENIQQPTYITWVYMSKFINYIFRYILFVLCKSVWELVKNKKKYNKISKKKLAMNK